MFSNLRNELHRNLPIHLQFMQITSIDFSNITKLSLSMSSPPDQPPVQIYAFDFDGTITTEDTLALFLKYYQGRAKWASKVLTLLPQFALYGLKVIDRTQVKRHVMRRFFKGHALADVQARADSFARDVIPGLIRPQAQARLDELKAQNAALYIVSASIEHYLHPWAASQGIKTVFATQLETVEGRLTGELHGFNVWGEGKIARIRAEMGHTPYEIVEAYGDSEGDKPLLYAAKASFWRPFRL